MQERFEHKKLSKQRSGSDYCELMSQFAPFLGQIAGPYQVNFSHTIKSTLNFKYELRT